ncbi:PaaI family thioesterase [Pseudomonas nitroreducens]|uniref:PaaI family thioesterase n=1 Tax=Pseudomonas nitroreducens TaxID=46680 RepID=UPI0034670936
MRGLDPLLTHLGILGAPQFDEDGVSMCLQLAEHHMNGGATAHGGLIMTLMDAVLACCTLGHGDGRPCVTIELKTNFMRPGGSLAGCCMPVADCVQAVGLWLSAMEKSVARAVSWLPRLRGPSSMSAARCRWSKYSSRRHVAAA